MWVILWTSLIISCIFLVVLFCLAISFSYDTSGNDFRKAIIAFICDFCVIWVLFLILSCQPMVLKYKHAVGSYTEEVLYSSLKPNGQSRYRIIYQEGNSVKYIIDVTNKKPVSISEFAPIQFGLNKLVVNFEEQKGE